jgi:hypothetical protein
VLVIEGSSPDYLAVLHNRLQQCGRATIPEALNIDSSVAWTVFGVLATILFGGWSLYYAIVGRRYPGRISFIQEDCIGLFDSIVRNFPEIVISYKNTPVGKDLVLLKGAFLNTGTKDVTKEMVAVPLTVALPAAHHWLTARVVAASMDVISSITHHDDVHFTFFANDGGVRLAEHEKGVAAKRVAFFTAAKQTAEGSDYVNLRVLRYAGFAVPLSAGIQIGGCVRRGSAICVEGTATVVGTFDLLAERRLTS